MLCLSLFFFFSGSWLLCTIEQRKVAQLLELAVVGNITPEVGGKVLVLRSLSLSLNQ